MEKVRTQDSEMVLVFNNFRLISFLEEKEGSVTTCEDIYTRFCNANPNRSISKQLVSKNVSSLYPNCQKIKVRYNGKLVHAFKSLYIRQNTSPPKPTPSMVYGEVELVPTGDIKDGNYVSFLVKSHPTRVLLNNSSIPLTKFGLGLTTDLAVIKAVISKARLCRGAPGGGVKWTKANSTEIYYGSSSKTCHLVVPNGTKVCAACKQHDMYNRRKPSPTAPENASILDCPTADQHETKTEKIEKLHNLLKDLGMSQEHADLLVESVKNEVATNKTQRRWTTR